VTVPLILVIPPPPIVTVNAPLLLPGVSVYVPPETVIVPVLLPFSFPLTVSVYASPFAAFAALEIVSV
jgi:hypothetical protein